MARNYSNVAEETALSTGINSSETSIAVGSNTGYPSVPYTILIDPGLATEEVCEVTAVVGTTWTITRGVDGTAASSHDSGAVVVHGYSARDLRDIQDHIADSTGVHGLASSSSVVGTTDTQTMANKTLTAPTINGGTLNSVTLGTGLTLQSPILVTPTIASFINATHDHSNAANGGEIEGGGSGGGTTGLAYKRSRDTPTPVAISSAGDAGAAPIPLPDLDYNVGGNTTWAVNGSSTRITLPTDVANGVWHVSATAQASVDIETDGPFINIVHQDAGIVATDGNTLAFSSSSQRRLSASGDFQAVSAGRWIEVRLGTDEAAPVDIQVEYASISIHRVA
jgi:hypothetical protein